MKKKALKFGLTITLLAVGILFLVPLGLQWFSGEMSDDGSLVTIQAAKRVCDLRFLSNDELRTVGNDLFHRAYPNSYLVPTFETRIWNAHNGKPILRRPLPSRAKEKPIFSHDGKLLFEGWFKKQENRGGMTLTRTDDGAVVRRWTTNLMYGSHWVLSPNQKTAVAAIELNPFNNVSKNLKSRKRRGGIGAWNVASGKPIWFAEETLSKNSFYCHYITYVAFSPDSKILAEASTIWASGSGFPIKLLLRDAKTGRQLQMLAVDTVTETIGGLPAGGWRNLIFSSDGRFLAVICNSTTKTRQSPSWNCSISLWDVKTGQQVWESKQANAKPETIIFSPDGSIIACGGYTLDRPDGIPGGRIDLLDTKTGKIIRSMTRETRAEALNYAWGARLRKIQRKFSGTTGWTKSPDDKSFPVTHLAFSPDGKRLAVAHEDGVVKIWPVEQ